MLNKHIISGFNQYHIICTMWTSQDKIFQVSFAKCEKCEIN